MIAPPSSLGVVVRILDVVGHERGAGPTPDLGDRSQLDASRVPPPRVLIADDEPMVRDAVQELLEDMGFDVVGVAADGQAALTLAGELHPDVVLMDLRMPVLDGVEATRRIRKAYRDVQVLLLSAYDDPAFRKAADRAGAYGYLAKGCRPAELEQALRSAAGCDPARGAAGHLGTVVVPDADEP